MAGIRLRLRQLLERMPPHTWQTQIYADGEAWTVADIVAHLIDAETALQNQIQQIVADTSALPADFDVAHWNATLSQRVETRDPQALLQKLAQVRAQTLTLMDQLPAEAWKKTGDHPVLGEITISRFFEAMTGHELMHMRDIRDVMSNESL